MRLWGQILGLSVISMAYPAGGAPIDPKEKEETLQTIMRAEETKQFTGSPISLKLKDADINEVLRMIGETSGFNIIIHPSVTGRITLSLESVPWDQALEIVMNTMGLAADRNESVLRVMPRATLIQEKQAELDAKRLASSSAPRITRVFPISYADMASLSALITSFTSAQNATPGASSVGSTVLTDVNTQSLIVRDTPENIERIRKMIELLDVQTPQVMIEAKAIEATESFTKNLEGNVAWSGPGYGVSINSQLTNATAGATGTALSSGGAAGGSRTNGITLNLAETLSLNAVLNYSEQMSSVKVISSPRMVVLSGRAANIVQGSNLPVTTVVQTAAGSQSGTTFIPYNTSLNVTPRVTNDGSVFMRLSLSRDTVEVFNGTAVTSPRTMGTEVIVESGNTIVLGGVLSIDDTKGEQGIPFLRKIPILGWLFGSDTYSKKKTELMFFVTPRILNSKKAGVLDPAEGASGKL